MCLLACLLCSFTPVYVQRPPQLYFIGLPFVLLCQGYLDGERAVSNLERSHSPAAFLDDLEDLPGFANPSSSENLKRVLCVGGYDANPKPSLMCTIQK